MDKLRRETGQKLLNAAQEFWEACHKEDPMASGAVQWLSGTKGELVIYTRFEYKDNLMQNIHMLPSHKVHKFGETMPTLCEECKAELIRDDIESDEYLCASCRTVNDDK